MKATDVEGMAEMVFDEDAVLGGVRPEPTTFSSADCGVSRAFSESGAASTGRKSRSSEESLSPMTAASLGGRSVLQGTLSCERVGETAVGGLAKITFDEEADLIKLIFLHVK